jgi:hypothetical protein
MAAPVKYGLKYFHIPINFPNQPALLKAEEKLGIEFCDHVLNIATRLHCLIYSFGYYMKWDEENAYQIAKYAGRTITSETVIKIINALVETGFFDRELFEKYSILTSVEIQQSWRGAIKSLKRKAFIDNKYELSPRNAGVSSGTNELSPEGSTVKTEGSKVKRKEVSESAQEPPQNGKETYRKESNSKEYIVNKGSSIVTTTTEGENGNFEEKAGEEKAPPPSAPPPHDFGGDIESFSVQLLSPEVAMRHYFSSKELFISRNALLGVVFYQHIKEGYDLNFFQNKLEQWGEVFLLHLQSEKQNQHKTVYQFGEHFSRWMKKIRQLPDTDIMQPEQFFTIKKTNEHGKTGGSGHKTNSSGNSGAGRSQKNTGRDRTYRDKA